MKYKIVKQTELSGRKANVYTVQVEGDAYENALERFVAEHIAAYPEQVKAILATLEAMGHVVGARRNFFKHEEGKPGDGVCRLYYDDPDQTLRLYCIYQGTELIVVGGGGPKFVRAWQDDKKLKKEAETLMSVSAAIQQRIKDKDIRFSINEPLDFKGNLDFTDTDDE